MKVLISKQMQIKEEGPWESVDDTTVEKGR